MAHDHGGQRLVEALTPAVRGVLLTPAAPGYEGARQVWNGTVDRSPLAVLQAADTEDVAAAVRATAALGLPLAVRGGGHGLPGFGTCDGGLVLDLRRLCAVTVDPGTRTARVQGGATWADYDGATARHGLASPGGLVSTTGVGGLTLGGGIGWLTGPHGLACDNLLGAELVTAGGELVRATPVHNPDLFWALRGGGGNFGVVTSFEFRVHPVDSVQSGMLLFPLSRAVEVLQAARAWTPELPDQCTALLSMFDAADTEDLPGDLRGQPCLAALVCHTGSPEQAAEDLRPLRALRPLVDELHEVSYPALQKTFDGDYPAGDRYFFSGAFTDGIPDGMIEALVAAMAARPSSRCAVDLHYMGGAAARVPEEETAYSGRRARYTVNVIAAWRGAERDAEHQAWARRSRSGLEPFTIDRGYVNFATDDDAPEQLEARYGRDLFARLRAVKRTWDPENLFRVNQNVTPAGSPGKAD